MPSLVGSEMCIRDSVYTAAKRRVTPREMGLLARRGCLRHIKMAATAKAFVCTYNKCACLPRTQRKQQQRKHCCGVNKHASLWDLERRTVVVSKKTYCCRVCMLRASKREKNTSAESSKQRTESSTEFAAGKEKQHNCPTCARQRKKAVNACISCYICLLYTSPSPRD